MKNSPVPLELAQLSELQKKLDRGDIHGFYKDLLNQGYLYAGWADGVARENTLAGVAAVEFLTGTAGTGIAGQKGVVLTGTQIHSIKADMAQAYLSTLVQIADTYPDNSTHRDISATEMYQFHKEVFENNGIGIQNWTLYAVFEIIERLEGHEAVERLWTKLHATEGDYADATIANFEILILMKDWSSSSDPEIAALAKDWLEHVPGVFSAGQWLRSVVTAGSTLGHEMTPALLLMTQAMSPAPLLHADTFLKMHSAWTAATVWILKRDPLVLDMDGDGLETTSVSLEPVMFDHTGDGIKTASGWIKSDDAFLVLDRNGNGFIDNGTELFGDATPLQSGGKARDGFAALAQEDTNADGRVDSKDMNWEKLKIWFDKNHNGLSEANELLTVSAAGIAAINVAKISNNQVLGNGNVLADLGKFSNADGSTGTIGEVANMGDINFVADPFYSSFTNKLPIDALTKSLPNMKGAGKVRDLLEASTLSVELKELLMEFGKTDSRNVQLGLMDRILTKWADTSGMAETLAAHAGPGPQVGYWSIGQKTTANSSATEWLQVVNDFEKKAHVLEAFNGKYFFHLPGDGAGSGAITGLSVQNISWPPSVVISASISSQQLDLLESAYQQLRNEVYESLAIQSRLMPYFDKIMARVDEFGLKLDFSILNKSIEDELVARPDVALADLVDLINFSVSGWYGSGWAGPDLLSRHLANAAITPHLLDIRTSLGISILDDVHPSGGASGIIMGSSKDDSIVGALANKVLLGGDGNDTITDSDGNDTIFGGGGRDTISDANGSDTIDGGDGDDKITDSGYGTNLLRGGAGNDTIIFSWEASNTIEGGSGNDWVQVANYPGYTGVAPIAYPNVIVGGTGDDTLSGSADADRYVFNRGDGRDWITASGANDQIVFGPGITLSDLEFSRASGRLDLIIQVAGADNAAITDQLTLASWFNGAAQQAEIIFADGTKLTAAQISALGNIIYGTGASDTLSGCYDGGAINGLGGDDTISDSDGSDTIDGGDGDDKIADNGSGINILRGGAGNDTITFSWGASNTIEGGSGNDSVQVASYYYNGALPNTYQNDINGGGGDDTLSGSASVDRYLFNRGDGRDLITAYGANDQIVFGPGITLSDLQFSRTSGSLDLIIKIAGADSAATSDQLTLSYWFSAAAQQAEIIFADGTKLTTAQISALGNILTGTAGGDTLSGYSDGSAINGLGGNDTISDPNGSDTIDGGDGDDKITDSGSGTNLLRGGAGNDTIIYSWGASNTIEGGSGNDSVQVASYGYGSAPNTYQNDIVGGTGDDTLTGSTSVDRYLFNRGDGRDLITAYGANDQIVFGPGITLSDLQFSRTSGSADLVIKVAGADNAATTDQLTLSYWFNGATQQAEIIFADGTKLTTPQISAFGNMISGTAASDTLSGYSDGGAINGLGGNDTISDPNGSDTIDGGDGDDKITDSGSGTNLLRGGAGNDTIIFSWGGSNTIEGGSGNDSVQVATYPGYNGVPPNTYQNTITGGAGDDTLSGSASVDRYLFNRGDGRDVIAAYGANDQIVFGPGIGSGDLQFSRISGEGNLIIRIQDMKNSAVADQLIVRNWFVSNEYKVELIFDDGSKLLAPEIALVGVSAAA